MKLTIILAAISVFINVSTAAVASCEPSLDLNGTIDLNRDYEGRVESYDDVQADDEVKVILPIGQYTITAQLELTKESARRCEYKATGLHLEGTDPSFSWTAEETQRARIERSTDGEWTRFHLNGFTPKASKRLVGASGRRISVQYEGERPLSLGTTISEMLAHGAAAEGTVAYFDFGDGHEFYGDVSLQLTRRR